MNLYFNKKMESKTNYHPKVKKDLSELVLPFFDNEKNRVNLLTSEEIEAGVQEIIKRVHFSGPSFCYVAEMPELQFYYFSESVEKIIGRTPQEMVASNGHLLLGSYDGDFDLITKITAKSYEALHKLDFETRKESSINLYYNMKNYLTNRSFAVVQQAFPLTFDDKGFMKGFVAVTTDISFYTNIKQPKGAIVSRDGEVMFEITSDILVENRLSDREFEILKLFAQGKTNEHVADELNLSYHTVRTHRKNILKKTNFSTLEDVIAYYKNLLGK